MLLYLRNLHVIGYSSYSKSEFNNVLRVKQNRVCVCTWFEWAEKPKATREVSYYLETTVLLFKRK